jgi:hypothetical protein
MSKKQLKILSAKITRPTHASASAALKPGVEAPDVVPTPVPERMQLSVAVENPTDKPLHVWASRRAYDYDPATQVLTLFLTEQTPPPPPGIEMISNHPRSPAQVVVPPGSQATVNVAVPSIIRRRVQGAQGLGMQFVEEPIGPVARVDLHVQVDNEPIQYRVGESPEEHRKRLNERGQVVRATITPTGQKEK